MERDYHARRGTAANNRSNDTAKRSFLIERCADEHAAANGHAANGYAGQFAYDCDDDPDHEEEFADDDNEDDDEIAKNDKNEPLSAFLHRQLQNVIHFFVEDWFLSAMLGVITAVLSISVDVAIEYLQQFRLILYEHALKFHAYSAAICWILYITLMTGGAAAVCHAFSKHAVGSGIPEVKVIMHGFVMKNYLTFKTLIVKMISLTLALGSGLPIGKEGPFVHMGAIVASLLTRVTSACRYQAFFSNEGRRMELLSSGCAVGIACTFSAPAGGVLYGIESTSKYFAVKNYWRAFFATTFSAIIFRLANALIIPPNTSGTITAYYQTSFPNEVFLVEEIPIFALIGVLSGLAGALFVYLHRQIAYFRQRNRVFQAIFGRKNSLWFTVFMAVVVGVLTYPDGFGRFFAGQLTFRETLADFLSNCTFSQANLTERGCPLSMIEHWRGGASHDLSILTTLSIYCSIYFVLVAICVSLEVPAGIFVPSFVIGACGGRLIGELMAIAFPEGLRGPDGPQIFPGLYAVVGAAAYTGSVTHSLSIAVIVCETTGQLCALLPVLIALMIGNAISSFLQPSVYESIIRIKNYPHLADLPPSRVSVHTLKVERVMIRDVICITRETTYKELRDILLSTPNLRSYPLVTDMKSKILLGSVARKYLNYLLLQRLGPDPTLLCKERRRLRTPSDLFASTFRRYSSNYNTVTGTFLTDRNISGNTLLANSPLHEIQNERGPLVPFLKRQSEPELSAQLTLVDRVMQLKQRIDLDDIAIDPAPFQLVMGTSLYKVHTLFSLLSLNHAYVTHRGRLVGVIAIKELREALADIYTRGAVPTHSSRRSTLSLSPPYAEQASPTITVDKMTSPISGIHVPVLSSMPISATSQTIQTSQTLAPETTDSAASGSRRMSADSCASGSTGPYRNTIQLSSRNSNANETLDDNEEENLLT